MPAGTDLEKSPIGCTTENPDPAKFNSWCKKNKVLWPKCTTGVSASTGRCVLASQDIAAGEVVVEVPDDMVLMAENCDIQDILEGEGLTKPADDALLEVQGLVLAVMYERALGSKSKWGPYLSFLPADMSHMIMYWEESELAELVGTAAHDKLVGRVQHPADAPTRVRQLFEELVVPFVLSHERVAEVLLGKAWNKLSQDDARDKLWQPYLWSTAAVASYSFVLGDEQYQGMVAVWDLLNHITGAVNVKLHHDADKGVLQMIATEPILKGREVVNCYGHLSNAELLRGYGYVEQHNTIKHVHIPAHFCIKAAAAAATAAGAAGAGGKAAAGKGRKQSTAAAADCDGEQQSDDDLSSGSEGEDVSPSEDGDGSEGEDESSSEGDESSSDESEPDWDLEDDSPEDLEQQQKRQQQHWAQQQQQQGADGPARKKQKRQRQQQQQQQQQQQHFTIPSLAEAQEQIADWEERWQLCFSLGLLPKNGVFQVPAGGLSSCPGQLLALLLLLLADAEDCAALAAASAAASNAAAKAAVAAAAGDGKKSSSKQKGSKQQQGKKTGGAKRSRDVGQRQESEVQQDPAAAVKEKLAALQFTSAQSLVLSLQQLVVLMVSRYSCSLQEDQQLLQQRDSLAPRLAAAVTARSGEKEVWAELQHALQFADAPQQVLQQARDALAQAVLAAAQEAATAAIQKAQHCCGVPDCEHTHDHEHEHGQDDEGDEDEHEHEHEHGKKRSKMGKAADVDKSAAAAGGAEQGFSFNFAL